MTKLKYDELVEEAIPFVGKNFTILERISHRNIQKRVNTYKFIEIPSVLQVLEDGKGYKAFGLVENIVTGNRKRIPLKIIIDAFSNNS